jgi:hypothetical protein
MVMKVETRSILIASCPIAIWFITTNLTRTGPEINPGFCCDRPRTNRLSQIDIQATSVCLSSCCNIDTKRVASSGTASDVPSENTRLKCRDGTLNQVSSDLSQASPVHRTPIEPFYKVIPKSFKTSVIKHR